MLIYMHYQISMIGNHFDNGTLAKRATIVGSAKLLSAVCIGMVAAIDREGKPEPINHSDL